ncbi:hypothetical protein EDB84DRAFT_981865 [Lactarius hengduanensis]|nr:hypothetical protein EDB84DRAFT_981865 [Lactarius hengduanensis]
MPGLCCSKHVLALHGVLFTSVTPGAALGSPAITTWVLSALVTWLLRWTGQPPVARTVPKSTVISFLGNHFPEISMYALQSFLF